MLGYPMEKKDMSKKEMDKKWNKHLPVYWRTRLDSKLWGHDENI